MLNFKLPGADALNDARARIDSLPQILEAFAKVPAMVQSMPPAPVVLGAVSRMVAGAIAGELRRRGPSATFLEIGATAGVDEATARRLFDGVLADIEATK